MSSIKELQSKRGFSGRVRIILDEGGSASPDDVTDGEAALFTKLADGLRRQPVFEPD